MSTLPATLRSGETVKSKKSVAIREVALVAFRH